MTRNDIIRLARKAGFVVDELSKHYQPNCITHTYYLVDELLERFAALVAAHEREKVAAWMMQRGLATGHGETVEEMLGEMQWQVAEAEREACAKVCEEIEMQGHALWKRTYDPDAQGRSTGAADCAAAIRARGEK